MSADSPLEPSKTHKQENFPVASRLIAPQYRSAILAYYRFARGADDVVDNGALSSEEKLAGLDAFEATLLGDSDLVEAAKPLRAILAERKLSPRHALDLLRAFRMDAVKNRYATWDELMHYCAYSAAPVGRFVLDVHGESEATWPASDALCAALQVINHLQDCAADFRNLDRVYLPQDALAAQGIGLEALRAGQASEGLQRVLAGLNQRNAKLIEAGALLPAQVRDFRLCLETAVIVRLARQLNRILSERDPLSETVHLGKAGVLAWSTIGALTGLMTFSRRSAPLAAKPVSGA
jgi:squalene synthase HpnC